MAVQKYNINAKITPPSKKGVCSVILRVTSKARRVDLYTGITLAEKQWKDGKVKQGCIVNGQDFNILNDYIREQEGFVATYFKNCALRGELADLDELKRQKYYGDERDNGNGSLMRIIPLLFYIKGKPIKEQFEIVWEISALTHRHIRAAMSCMIYLKLAEKLLEGKNKIDAYTEMRSEIIEFWNEIEFCEKERKHFNRLIQSDIRETKIDVLKSGGYVIEVLESSIWFFLNKDTYEETILSIINLGHDTDTSAAIVGGLAGIYYGQRGIPESWVVSIARLDDIVELGNRLNEEYCDNNKGWKRLLSS